VSQELCLESGGGQALVDALSSCLEADWKGNISVNRGQRSVIKFLGRGVKAI